MKNFTLAAFILATTISFANENEKINPVAITKKQKLEISKSTDKTVYFWEVSTTTGSASGYAMSEAQALKTIKLMGTNDLVTYRIIEAYKQYLKLNTGFMAFFLQKNSFYISSIAKKVKRISLFFI